MQYGLFAIGDSKTGGDDWPGQVISNLQLDRRENWLEVGPRFGIAGATVSSMRAHIDSNLSGVSGDAQIVIINLGANDVFALPSSSAWQTNLNAMIYAVLSKFVDPLIYVVLPWIRDKESECDTVAAWIADVIATINNSNVRQGIDERVVLKGSDNGVTNTVDGIHPNAAGNTAIAQAWNLLL